MNQPATVVGIEVSKDSLAVCYQVADKLQHLEVSNSKASFQQLVRRCGVACCYMMEATGVSYLVPGLHLVEHGAQVAVLTHSGALSRCTWAKATAAAPVAASLPGSLSASRPYRYSRRPSSGSADWPAPARSCDLKCCRAEYIPCRKLTTSLKGRNALYNQV